jgi:NADPH:quinone reductase-like Zn-dependent oxidoreductase
MGQPNGAELEEIRALIDTGQVTPFIDRVFPLTEVAQAQTYLEHEHVRGKVAVRVG